MKTHLNNESHLYENFVSLLRKKDLYSFPDFLFLLRDSHQLPRRFVAEKIGKTSHQLFLLEHGLFKKSKGVPLEKICEFYCISFEMMKEKLDKYILFLQKETKNKSTPAKERKKRIKK